VGPVIWMPTESRAGPNQGIQFLLRGAERARRGARRGAPHGWPDLAALMRENGVPQSTVDKPTEPVRRSFDVLG